RCATSRRAARPLAIAQPAQRADDHERRQHRTDRYDAGEHPLIFARRALLAAQALEQVQRARGQGFAAPREGAREDDGLVARAEARAVGEEALADGFDL